MLRVKQIFLVIAVAFLFFPNFICKAEAVSTPTINNIKQVSGALIITGETETNTKVLLFLESVFIGSTENLVDLGDGKSSYTFFFKKTLGQGKYSFAAKSQDKASYAISNFSKPFLFEVVGGAENNNSSGQLVAAPTLIEPNVKLAISTNRPRITGLTNSGTYVEIYIDGQYDGKTDVLTDISGTADFFYIPQRDLLIGQHYIYGIAVNVKGERSVVSEKATFYIEPKLPAPILKDPVVNKDDASTVEVIGWSKNDLRINLYVDDKYIGSTQVQNAESGTGSFVYKINKPLTNGGHLVYTIAIDSRGKTSDRSNYVYFFAGENLEPSIGETAAEEPKINETQVLSDKDVENSRSSMDKDSVENNVLDVILNRDEKTSTGSSGMINESKENQSKLKWDVTIFILFLLAVIVWIFWVNKELIKEKREQNKKTEVVSGDDDQKK